MTDYVIASFVGALVVCYFVGLKIGKFVRMIKELGNSA